MEWGISSMSLRDFIKDKLYLIVASIIIIFVYLGFFHFLGISKSLAFMILIGLTFLPLLVLIVEFYRRRKYYNNIYIELETIEDKHLIYDVIEEKSFIDARVMQDVVRLGNHSMNSKVELYKQNQEEYQHYIELWVHEVKTPLSALKLMMSNRNDDQALEEIEQVNYYIDQALYYARSTSVYKDYLIETVDLDQIVKSTIKQLSNNFIKNDLSLELQLDSQTVYSDSKWLGFIIKQILINSIQYSVKSGKVIIKAYDDKQNVKLEIIDNGIGILDADIARIFEMGFTGASGRKYNQATGMGLYLVSKLSESLNILIKVDNSELTKVTLTIPKSDMHFK